MYNNLHTQTIILLAVHYQLERFIQNLKYTVAHICECILPTAMRTALFLFITGWWQFLTDDSRQPIGPMFS